MVNKILKAIHNLGKGQKESPGRFPAPPGYSKSPGRPSQRLISPRKAIFVPSSAKLGNIRRTPEKLLTSIDRC